MPTIPSFGFSDTPESLRAREDALFKEWREYLAPLPFLRDGAGPEYARSPRRLLFLLKEGNDPQGVWADPPDGDLRRAHEWNYDDPYARPTWHPLVRWAAYILDGVDIPAITQELWKSVVSRIAVVNVKKWPGGATAHGATVLATLKDHRYAQFLDQQVDYYYPRVTICGSDLVGECVGELRGWPEQSWPKYRCSRTGGDDPDEISHRQSSSLGLTISFWHPAQRSRSDVFDILREVIDALAR